MPSTTDSSINLTPARHIPRRVCAQHLRNIEAEWANVHALGAAESKQSRLPSNVARACEEVSKWINETQQVKRAKSIPILRTWRETGFYPSTSGPVLLNLSPVEIFDHAAYQNKGIGAPLLHLAASLANTQALGVLLETGTPVRPLE